MGKQADRSRDSTCTAGLLIILLACEAKCSVLTSEWESRVRYGGAGLYLYGGPIDDIFSTRGEVQRVSRLLD
jgi:hypothetical protein